MRVAFYLPGHIPIYSYALFLGFGASLGLAWVAWRSENDRLAGVEAGLWALVAGLLGARIVYVLLNWAYFQDNLLEALLLSRGGLAWPGALIGGILGTALFARIKKTSVGELFDTLLPLGATIAVSAWLGCWVDGCAYGPLAPNDWWGVPTTDQWGQVAARWPTQLFGAVLVLGLVWSLDLAREHFPRPGYRATLCLLLFSLQLVVLSLLRADPTPRWGGLRLETWAALAFVFLSGLLLLATRGTSPVNSPAEPNLNPELLDHEK